MDTPANNSIIERVRRWFLRFAGLLPGISHAQHDYNPALIRLGLESLVERRRALTSKFLKYNTLSSKTDLLTHLSLIYFKVPYTSVISEILLHILSLHYSPHI